MSNFALPAPENVPLQALQQRRQRIGTELDRINDSSVLFFDRLTLVNQLQAKATLLDEQIAIVNAQTQYDSNVAQVTQALQQNQLAQTQLEQLRVQVIAELDQRRRASALQDEINSIDQVARYFPLDEQRQAKRQQLVQQLGGAQTFDPQQASTLATEYETRWRQLQQEQTQLQGQQLQLVQVSHLTQTRQQRFVAIEQQLRTEAQPFNNNPVDAIVLPCQSAATNYLDRALRHAIVESMQRLNDMTTNSGDQRFIYAHNRNDLEETCVLPNSHWRAKQPSCHNHRNPQPNESLNMAFHSRPNVTAADALRSLFSSQQQVVIECLTGIYICYHRALLQVVGDQRYNQMFPNGIDLDPNTSMQQLGNYMNEITLNHPNQLQPGDWVYFYNHPDYLRRHNESQGNALQGENALFCGNDNYIGFGMTGSQQSITTTLQDAYNAPPTYWNNHRGQYEYARRNDQAYPALQQGQSIPGLYSPNSGQLDPVFRPNPDAI